MCMSTSTLSALKPGHVLENGTTCKPNEVTPEQVEAKFFVHVTDQFRNSNSASVNQIN